MKSSFNGEFFSQIVHKWIIIDKEAFLSCPEEYQDQFLEALFNGAS